MSQSKCQGLPKSVALVGACPPRRCGVAVFTSSLCDAVRQAIGSCGKVYAVAVNDVPEGYRYGEEVRFTLAANLPRDYRHAAEFLNTHEADGVLLQHDFDIYGGPAGSHVLRLLRELHMPVIVTLHSVPDRPSDDQRTALAQMADVTDRFVVMTRRASEVLAGEWGMDRERISCIPHGIPDVPFLDPEVHKEDLGLAGRKVILTFGLLTPEKGIEHMIAAMPAVLRRHPEAIYVVLGVTHPRVRARCGEQYRQGLYDQVRRMGLEQHVTFRSRFASQEELGWYLTAADVCVTPNLNESQMTSGVLAYSMGSGNAVISTPYWHAREMLADDRGILVPFGDSEALAREVADLLDDDRRREQLRRRAYDFTRPMVWPGVARQYLELLSQATLERGRSAQRPVSLADPMGWSEIVPEIDLRHLRIMTDSCGMAQHAVYATPDRRHGYCTDDNARALMVAMWYWDLREDGSMLPLISTYLAFLVHAFNEKHRRFRNFMSYSREWLEEVGSDDSHARSIMACGLTADLTRDDNTLGLAVRLFNDALPVVEDFRAVRSWAYTLIGIDSYLRRFPGDTAAQRMLEMLGNRLLAEFGRVASDDWPWLEESLTWGNARVPQGLLLAGARLDSAAMIETALRCLRWQLQLQTTEEGHLSVIGNQGWYPQGGQRARFDQQPIEVMSLAEACGAAYSVTRDRSWLVEIRRCLEWFLGRNDLGMPLYDVSTGGCRDGLSASGVNANQGAESTLAWLATLLLVHRLQVSETLSLAKSPAGSIELQDRVI